MYREASVLVLEGRWWCEHRRELRLDVHFDDGHIGVELYILYRSPTPRLRAYLRSSTAQIVSPFANMEVHPNSLAHKILRFPKAEGARLLACMRIWKPSLARCTLDSLRDWTLMPGS